MSLEKTLRLAQKIASDKYSSQELDQFLAYLDSADAGEVDLILKTYQQALDEQDHYPSYVSSDFMRRLEALDIESAAPAISIARESVRMPWTRWAAAAAIVITVAGIGRLYFHHPTKNERPNALSAISIPADRDIKAPSANRATITLAGGQKVFLDSAANGQLALQNHVRLVKMAEGKIGYEGAAAAAGEVIYNTLTNPKGSKVVDITLADGSRVWLNAGSSLTYPVAFTGKQRNVQFTGEAYFEISPDASRPFTVTRAGDDLRVDVLGTRFNVNAYADEAAVKVSLLDGSVKVNKGMASSLLRPRQQVQIKEDKHKIIKDIDIDEVMAWKNDKFQFSEKTDIEMIMRQIARWYDLDVQYSGKVNEHFWGSISRTVNASQVFNMLQATGFVKFQVEGRKVIVMPATQ